MSEQVLTPKISIIIPCYNVEKYLRECLDSVVNQTLKDIEIICVNDGSTDGTQKILEEYSKKDDRIALINKPNGGLSSARNAGMEKVHGEYLAFLDSDDWVDLNFYEKLYNAAKLENADSAIGKINIYSEYDKQISQSKQISYIKHSVIRHVKDKRHVIYSCSVWGKIYKTSVVKNNKLRFVEGIYMEDVPFTFAVAIIANKYVIVPDTAIYYREHERSIMANVRNTKELFDIFKCIDACEKFLQEIQIEDKTRKQYQNILDVFIIVHLFRYYWICSSELKQDFWVRMLEKLKNVNIFFNPYMNVESIRACVKIFVHITGNFVRKILYIEIEQKKY